MECVTQELNILQGLFPSALVNHDITIKVHCAQIKSVI